MKYTLISLCLVIIYNLQAQRYPLDNKRDYVWTVGYQGSKLTFDGSNSAPITSRYNLPFTDVFRIYNSICDTNGLLLCHTNGAQIATRSHTITPDNDSIGVSSGILGFTMSSFADGYRLFQGTLLLPWPDNPDRVAIVHEAFEYINAPHAFDVNHVFFSGFDKTLGPEGDLFFKDSIMLSTRDSLAYGHLSACRHANGRDWWIIAPQRKSNIYHRFLLNPSGLSYSGKQLIGNQLGNIYNGQASFSPNGERYVYNLGDFLGFDGGVQNINIFDFDRCTGLLSNPIGRIQRDTNDVCFGSAWSSNSRFLYRTTAYKVFQIDMWNSDPLGSELLVANNDLSTDPDGFPFAFNTAQLAPNGKIYIAAGVTAKLHVIENPDSYGAACNVLQHSFTLPVLNDYVTPYFPNFRLGPVDGSPCDTLGIDVISSIDKAPMEEGLNIRVFPNPTDGVVQLSIPDGVQLSEVRVYDSVGRLVLRKNERNWASLDISALPNGVYFLESMNEGNIIMNRIKVVLAK